MIRKYFNIKYEFDRECVHQAIHERLSIPGSDYICVADGVVLNIANRQSEYLKVVNDGMFAICDSSYVPLYLRWIYGVRYQQYCGSEIFMDIVRQRRYRMIFLGAQREVLDGLREKLAEVNGDVRGMTFVELPFRDVDAFDYAEIARMVEADGAEIVWVALGAPKQEMFMHRLKPHLHRGVMLGVGAVFKFYSGQGVERAPEWMVKHHLEFVHRLCKEPGKQATRCWDIVRTLPRLLAGEIRRKKGQRRENEEFFRDFE